MNLNLVDKEQSESGGPPGRKFLFGRYALLLSTLGFLATALSVALSANFMTFIGGLGTLYAIYCGGNVGQKWATTKPAQVTQVIADRRKKEEPEEEPSETDGPGPAGA